MVRDLQAGQVDGWFALRRITGTIHDLAAA
jgi:hypothetical protein